MVSSESSRCHWIWSFWKSWKLLILKKKKLFKAFTDLEGTDSERRLACWTSQHSRQRSNDFWKKNTIMTAAPVEIPSTLELEACYSGGHYWRMSKKHPRNILLSPFVLQRLSQFRGQTLVPQLPVAPLLPSLSTFSASYVQLYLDGVCQPPICRRCGTCGCFKSLGKGKT